MTPYDPFDPFHLPALRLMSERSLELERRKLVVNLDAGCDPVNDELCRRALPAIVAAVRTFGDKKGLAREQQMKAVEETVANLQMRLRCNERLDIASVLAKSLAAEAVDSRAPEVPLPPQLVDRPPDLRPMTPPVADELPEAEPPEAEAEASDAHTAPEPPTGEQPPAPPTPRETSDPVNEGLGDALRRNQIKRNDPHNS